MSRVSSLHRLQEIDLSIDRARARLAEVEKLLGASDTVRAARASHDQGQVRLHVAQASVKDAELAAGTQRAKLENAERSLYGGGVHNPKELQGLQADVDSLRRHMSSLEDRLLEAMVALEDVEARARQAADQLSQAEAALVTEQASLAGECSQLQARLGTLETEREAALAGVAEKDLALYARLRDSMGGMALATLQDGSCGACGVGISAGERQTVRNSAEIFRCPQCGRILYAG
jgi:predicted  nucleic acid-binding Zn-ribbon protein